MAFACLLLSVVVGVPHYSHSDCTDSATTVDCTITCENADDCNGNTFSRTGEWHGRLLVVCKGDTTSGVLREGHLLHVQLLGDQRRVRAQAIRQRRLTEDELGEDSSEQEGAPLEDWELLGCLTLAEIEGNEGIRTI